MRAGEAQQVTVLAVSRLDQAPDDEPVRALLGGACVLPPFLADKPGLERPFHQVAEHADGRRGEVDVTEPILIEIEGRKVYEECLVLGDEMLIGQTALEKTDLHVDCRSRRLLPNPEHPYQPVVKIKQIGLVKVEDCSTAPPMPRSTGSG